MFHEAKRLEIIEGWSTYWQPLDRWKCKVNTDTAHMLHLAQWLIVRKSRINARRHTLGARDRIITDIDPGSLKLCCCPGEGVRQRWTRQEKSENSKMTKRTLSVAHALIPLLYQIQRIMILQGTETWQGRIQRSGFYLFPKCQQLTV